MKDKDNNAIVIKANQLIQNFKCDLNKTELRVVNMIISNIDSPLYDKEFNRMSFHVTDFYKFLGWDNLGGSDYNRLKEVLKKLSNNSSDYIPIGEKETIVRWIDKPYFHKRSGTVELKLDDDLKPFLLQANGYIKALLKYYAELESKYSMYIYELMKSWEGCRKKVIEINEFRTQINAGKKSYENFGKFHQGILKPSVEEINQVTDLDLTYETITDGKKVTHIVFYINKKEKKQKSEQLPDNQPRDDKQTEEDILFERQYGAMAACFPDFTKEQIIALYYAALANMDLIGQNYSMSDRELKVIDYIDPKWTKIKATPDATKSTPFYRLLNAVQNNY